MTYSIDRVRDLLVIALKDVSYVSDRSAKSAIVVPKVVEAMMVAQ